MIVRIDSAYFHATCKLVVGVYGNSRIALQLTDAETGEPQCTATVNLPEFELANGEVLLKCWSENEGIPEALEKAGIITRMGTFVPTGFVSAEVARLIIDPQEVWLEDNEDELTIEAAETGADRELDFDFEAFCQKRMDEVFGG